MNKEEQLQKEIAELEEKLWNKRAELLKLRKLKTEELRKIIDSQTVVAVEESWDCHSGSGTNLSGRLTPEAVEYVKRVMGELPHLEEVLDTAILYEDGSFELMSADPNPDFGTLERHEVKVNVGEIVDELLRKA